MSRHVGTAVAAVPRLLAPFTHHIRPRIKTASHQLESDAVSCEVRVGENLSGNRNETLRLKETYGRIPSVYADGLEAAIAASIQERRHEGAADASALAATLNGQMTEFHLPVAEGLPHDCTDYHTSVLCNQNNLLFGLSELLPDVSRKPYGSPEYVPQQLIHALRIAVNGGANADALW